MTPLPMAQVAVAVKRSKAAAAQDSPAEQHPGDSGENGEATPLAVDEAAPVVDGPAASARPAPAVPVLPLNFHLFHCGKSELPVHHVQGEMLARLIAVVHPLMPSLRAAEQQLVSHLAGPRAGGWAAGQDRARGGGGTHQRRRRGAPGAAPAGPRDGGPLGVPRRQGACCIPGRATVPR